MEVDGAETSAVPESVMDPVDRTLAIVEEVRSQFFDFLSFSDPDVLVELPPLQRAKSLLLLAKATTALFALRLRCNGVNTDEHPIKSELERLNLYQDKLERFIDLSNEQRQSMRHISRGEGKKIKVCRDECPKKEEVSINGEKICSKCRQGIS